MSTEREVDGGRLLTAVERLLAETSSLIAYSNDCMRRAKAKKLGDEEATIAEACKEVVAHYSTLTAVSGGAAALPALVPGIGSVVALTGGAFADVALILKFEVEMALVLTHLHGYDLRDPDERRIAFLLASVSTYDAKSGRNFFVDLAQSQAVALWNYGPREVSKLLATVLARLALLQVGKGLIRALPIVGIGVGASVNKVLTKRVGERCVQELRRRRTEDNEPKKRDDVVEAKVGSGS